MPDGDVAAFFRREGKRFLPTTHSRGPWDPNSLHGRVVAGLLGLDFEQRYCDPAFQFARLTVDLFRLPPMLPLTVESALVRQGNRIRVAEGVVRAGEQEVARGHALLLLRTEQPPDEAWRPEPWRVPSPDELGLPPEEPRFGRIWETRPIEGDYGLAGPRRTWLRENRLLVDGEPLTPFLRCAVAADFTNPFANSGPGGLPFVNADITLYLHRLPVGEWLGFEVASHQSADGIAVGETTMYDVTGPIGRSVVCAVANQRRR